MRAGELGVSVGRREHTAWAVAVGIGGVPGSQLLRVGNLLVLAGARFDLYPGAYSGRDLEEKR